MRSAGTGGKVLSGELSGVLSFDDEEEQELLSVAACEDIAVSAAGSEAAATVAGQGCGVSNSFYGSDQQLVGLGGAIAAAGSGQCRSCPLVSSETVYWVHLVAEDVFGNLQTEAVLLPWRGGY